MTFLSNQGEPISAWRMAKGIQRIQMKPDIFSNKNLREARIEFIAGTNRLQTIEGWLLAAGIFAKENGKRTTEYYLTFFGEALAKNDPNLRKSSTWWGIHLNLCFSSQSDPYSNIFKILNANFKNWMLWSDVLSKIGNNDAFKNYKPSSIESVSGGIRRMFEGDRTLAEIGIINVRKQSYPKETWLRLGSPELSDEVIIHALALAREKLFPTRISIDFIELIQKDVHSYLCLSQEEFRNNVRRLNNSDKWDTYFGYTETANLNSIHFGEDIKTSNTVLILAQSHIDTWL